MGEQRAVRIFDGFFLFFFNFFLKFFLFFVVFVLNFFIFKMNIRSCGHKIRLNSVEMS